MPFTHSRLLLNCVVVSKVAALALVFGLALGALPRFVWGLLIGQTPTYDLEHMRGLLFIYIVPSVILWTTSIPFLRHGSCIRSILIGLAWPFLTILVGAIIDQNPTHWGEYESLPEAIYATMGFMGFVIALPLGTTAGILFNRIMTTGNDTAL